MIYGLFILAIFVGTLMPIQAGLNAELTRFMKHPYMGALISFGTGTLALLIISLFHGLPLSELKRLSAAPPHLFLGGILGALFVSSSIFFIPKMGATMMIASFITGQLIMSVIIDHFGLLGLPVLPISFNRVLGILLLFAGLVLVVKKSA